MKAILSTEGKFGGSSNMKDRLICKYMCKQYLSDQSPMRTSQPQARPELRSLTRSSVLCGGIFEKLLMSMHCSAILTQLKPSSVKLEPSSVQLYLSSMELEPNSSELYVSFIELEPRLHGAVA